MNPPILFPTKIINALKGATGFLVFAIILFFGLWLGPMISGFLGLSGNDSLFAQAITFLISAAIVYFLWKKAEKAKA